MHSCPAPSKRNRIVGIQAEATGERSCCIAVERGLTCSTGTGITLMGARDAVLIVADDASSSDEDNSRVAARENMPHTRTKMNDIFSAQ